MLSSASLIRPSKSAVLRLLIVFICLIGVAETARATTVALPPDDDLIIGARAIIRGRVTAIQCAQNERRRIFTYVTVRVQEVFKGQIESRFITIKEMGGQIGSKGSIVFGSPRFKLDERVFLYLDTWRDGSLRSHQMFLGKFSIIEDEAGQSIVRRDVPDAYTSVLTITHPHTQRSFVTNRMELSAYARMVRERVAATRERAASFEQYHYSNISILDAPPEYAAGEKVFQPQFNLIANPPPRYFEPDDGLPVVFLVNTEGMFSPQMIEALNSAMNAWSNVPGSSLRVINGGTTGECIPPDVNSFAFNNCDQRFSPTPGCATILASGGVNWDARERKIINGKTFFRAHTGHVSFNPFASCFYQNLCNAAEIMTHELGHAIGFHHSWNSCDGCAPPTPLQREATMFPIAHFDGRCAAIRQDDVDGILFVYPSAGGGSGQLSIISPSTLAAGEIDKDYSLQLFASGGSQPYAWSLLPGQLPPGLSLSAGGLIGGKPASQGTFSFIVEVRDSQGASAQKNFSLAVEGVASQEDSQFMSQTVPARLKPGEGFTVNMKWLNTGASTWSGANEIRMHSQNPAFNKTWGGDTLPLHIFVVPAGQQLDVTFTAFAPRAPGVYDFQWQLYQDGIGFFGQLSENVKITVSDQNTVLITSSSPIEAVEGQALNYQLSAAGGVEPYSWQIASGALPAGLSLNESSGIISGTPATAGATTVTIQVADGESRTSQKSFAINVAPPPIEIITALVPSPQRGLPFSFQLAATGGKPPYNWQIVNGSLAQGLSLSSATGVISGTPTEAGLFTFGIVVRDQLSQSVGGSLQIKVIDPETIPVITAAKYKVGKRKLTVRGERINPAAALFIDGIEQPASPSDGVFVVKRLTLASGQHEIIIVNPGNTSSRAHTLTVK